MTAKEYLMQARYLDILIDSKIGQIESLESLATKANAVLTDMPESPTKNVHTRESVIAQMVDMKEEIGGDISRLINLKQELQGAINAVGDEQCRVLLEKRYLNFEAWSDIATDLHVGIDNVYKIHNKALGKVEVPEYLQ